MAKVHIAEDDDTLVRIAHQYGFQDWELIYQHEKNAALRELRPNPNILCRGDEVYVPDKTPKLVSIKTGAKASFTLKTLKAKFRIVVADEAGVPLKDKKFKLTVGAASHEGTTDQAAKIELDIDPDPTRGELTVWVGGNSDKVLTWSLRLGYLDPLSTNTGLQQRLTNLGYPVPVDGQIGPETQSALRSFQIVHGLSATAEPDDATRAKLGEMHDGT